MGDNNFGDFLKQVIPKLDIRLAMSLELLRPYLRRVNIRGQVSEAGTLAIPTVLVPWATPGAGADVAFPSAAGEPMTLTAADHGAATGCQVLVRGLDADGYDKDELMTFTGVDLTVPNLRRINFLRTVGSKSLTTLITLHKVDEPTIIYGQIEADRNISTQLIYTNPKDTVVLATRLRLGMRAPAGQTATVEPSVALRELDGVWLMPADPGLSEEGSSVLEVINEYPDKLPELTDFKILAGAEGTGPVKVAGVLTVLLVAAKDGKVLEI